jgi:hypothetical protein
MSETRTAETRFLAVQAVAVASTVALPVLGGYQQPLDPTTGPAPARPTTQLVEETSATADPSFFATNMLWRKIQSPVASLEAKLEALGRLCESNNPEVPRFTAERLSGTRLNLRWRAALVHSAEHVHCDNQEIRPSLAGGLYRSALVLRDANQSWTDAAVWAAVRTLGGLVQIEQAGVLREFLDDDRIKTRQVAFQALQGILARDPVAARRLPADVKQRAGELAELYLNRDFLISAENVALAANACCVALLANVPNIDQVRTKLAALGRPVLEKQVAHAMARSQGRVGE